MTDHQCLRFIISNPWRNLWFFFSRSFDEIHDFFPQLIGKILNFFWYRSMKFAFSSQPLDDIRGFNSRVIGEISWFISWSFDKNSRFFWPIDYIPDFFFAIDRRNPHFFCYRLMRFTGFFSRPVAFFLSLVQLKKIEVLFHYRLAMMRFTGFLSRPVAFFSSLV